jgi:hypothetical protein
VLEIYGIGGTTVANLKEKLIRLLADIGVVNPDTAAYYLALNNVSFVVPCEKCRYLKKCRACYRCNNTKGLPEPNPELGTFCSYGIERDLSEVVSNEVKTD